MECQQSDFCTAFTYDEDNKCVLHHLLCKPNEYPSTSFVKMDLGVCKGETMNCQAKVKSSQEKVKEKSPKKKDLTLLTLISSLHPPHTKLFKHF